MSETDRAQHEGPTVRDRRRIDPLTGELREPQSAAAPGAAPSAADETTADHETTSDQEENVKTHQPTGEGFPATDSTASQAPDTETQQAGEAHEASSPSDPLQTGAVEDPKLVELQTAVVERTADLQRLQAEYVNYKRRVDRDRDLTRQLGTEAVLRDLLDVLDGIAAARDHDELTGGFKSVADNLEKVMTRYGLSSFGEAGDPFDPQIHEALMHAHAPDVTGPTCVQVLQVGYRVKDKILRPARVAVAEPDSAAETASND